MKTHKNKMLLAGAVLLTGAMAVNACFETQQYVCLPAGTVIITDESIIPPCHQVTDQIVTGADAIGYHAVGTDCGGSAGSETYDNVNVIPLIEIGAAPAYTGGPCVITYTPAPGPGYTYTCPGSIAVGDACKPCG
jgi:hypothetical protein